MTTEEKLQHFYDVSMESAREEAQKALEEYRRALDDMFEEHKKEKEKSAELRLKLETENAKREINKALSAEQLHIKRKLSKKQQELREKIFIDLQAKLEIFRKSSDYPKWLEEKIKEAQNIADSDEIQIYLSKIDENLKESIEADPGISIQLSEEPFMGGMRAVIPAKNILIDQTFLTMFESEKEEFNFDNFVVGKNNREAQAAAMAVCHYPGQFYNPLFIYGNSGLGKTHLIHSIANYVKEIRPEDKVLYIYSEDFVTLIIESMKNKTVEEVKQKICSYDYVMIDDIQRLRQSTSQEVFFNLYNKLVGDNKQIVITSDIHPTELKGIENRLISRFSQGLTVSVGSPEFETAKAILLKKIEGRRESEILIQDEVLDFLATRFSSDVRKLEGSLNELFFKAVLYNPEIIDLDFAKEVFKENPVVAVVENTLNAQRIKSVVCEYYGLSVGQLESKSRTKNIANARHIAVYLCRKHLHMPFVKIGFEFGNRDHSTIMSSYEKMVKLLKDNETFQQAVFQLETKLGIGN